MDKTLRCNLLITNLNTVAFRSLVRAVLIVNMDLVKIKTTYLLIDTNSFQHPTQSIGQSSLLPLFLSRIANSVYEVSIDVNWRMVRWCCVCLCVRGLGVETPTGCYSPHSLIELYTYNVCMLQERRRRENNQRERRDLVSCQNRHFIPVYRIATYLISTYCST